MVINFYHGDCMNFMRDKPNGYYDLAIVDPPYGLSKSSTQGSGKLKNRSLNIGNVSLWDKAPDESYFAELFRCSNNQIIWGGNYFSLPPCRCFVVWDKMQPWENFSQCEYAWTSFQKPAKLYKFDNRTGDKIHPTQKPVVLYKWLLSTFAEKGMRILDTHGGSMSSAIAAYELGLDMDICEINDIYFAKGKERVEKAMQQQNLF